jgi:hypothetical protein
MNLSDAREIAQGKIVHEFSEGDHARLRHSIAAMSGMSKITRLEAGELVAIAMVQDHDDIGRRYRVEWGVFCAWVLPCDLVAPGEAAAS